MKGTNRHHAVEELLGVYALDALPADEIAAVEEHLAGCGRCRNEVAQHRQAAAALASLVETPAGSGGGPAPDGLWERIAAELDGGPEERPNLLPFALRDDRAPAFSSPIHRATGLLATAAVVAMVVAVGLGALLVRQDRRLDALSARNRQHTALAAALVDPATKRVQLTSEDGARSVGALMTGDGEAFLIAGSLPPVAGDRTYQLWAIDAGAARSVAVLGNRPGDVARFRLEGSAEVLAITVEEAGGAPQPTTDPVVRGFVPTAEA